MRLFLDDHQALVKEFRKEAGYTHRLSDSPDNWGQEIGSQLHKQLPFLSDYEVNVSLDKVDAGRGFAFGYADVTNKTERPELEHAEAGIPHMRIPLVAEERQVRPFSVFLDGERVLPMNEDRFRESLFNPATFDLSNSVPRDPSLVEPLMPPQRSGIGLGGEYKMASVEKRAFQHISKEQWAAIYQSPAVQKIVLRVGTYDNPEVTNVVYEQAIKHYGFHPKVYPMSEEDKSNLLQQIASKGKQKMQGIKGAEEKPKTASLLLAIAPTIREQDRDSFVDKIASDPSLQAGFKRSGIARTLVEAMDVKLASANDRLHALADNIQPSVVTLQKLPGGDFMVKSANVNAFAGGEQAAGQVMPFEEVAQAIGSDTAKSMQPGQVVTAVSDPVQLGEELPEASQATEFGEYKVQNADGKEMKGWVFPQMLAWDSDFTPQPLSVFTNGTQYAIQDEVAGSLVNKNSVPPSDIPKGEGIFWGKDENGPVATAPISIQHGSTGSNGVSRYVGTDPFGNQVTVAVVPDIKKPKMITENEFVVPKSWNFIRLNNKTKLSSAPSNYGTAKRVGKEKTSATLFYNNAYNIEGGCNLDKIASELRYDLDAVGAEFILGLLGVDGVTAKQKVAEARRKGSVKLAGLKPLQLLSERFEESVKTASAFLEQLPNLRRDLIKEAASIDDQGTVDKVLALNFINPENLSTFVSYLPELEQASEQMAEMVLAGYLGMKDIPVGAVERSMHNMEEVITGLKAVQHARG